MARASLQSEGFVIANEEALAYLPRGYEILNYSYSIEGQTLSTFHRDVTSSQYVYGTRHPTYTLIQYFYSGPHLSVCPQSHRQVPFLWSLPVLISGAEGQQILFNSDIVHAGAGTSTNRRVVQRKIAHREDIESGSLDHLLGVHSTKLGVSIVGGGGAATLVLRPLSWIFSFPINHIFTPLLQKPSGFPWLDNICRTWFGFYTA